MQQIPEPDYYVRHTRSRDGHPRARHYARFPVENRRSPSLVSDAVTEQCCVYEHHDYRFDVATGDGRDDSEWNTEVEDILVNKRDSEAAGLRETRSRKTTKADMQRSQPGVQTRSATKRAAAEATPNAPVTPGQPGTSRDPDGIGLPTRVDETPTQTMEVEDQAESTPKTTNADQNSQAPQASNTRPRRKVIVRSSRIPRPKPAPLSAWSFVSQATQPVCTREMLAKVPQCWEEFYKELMMIRPQGALLPEIPSIAEEGLSDVANMMEAEDAPSYRLTNTVTFCIVKIAGQKLKAIVDTGATQCVLAWRIASQLGLL